MKLSMITYSRFLRRTWISLRTARTPTRRPSMLRSDLVEQFLGRSRHTLPTAAPSGQGWVWSLSTHLSRTELPEHTLWLHPSPWALQSLSDKTGWALQMSSCLLTINPAGACPSLPFFCDTAFHSPNSTLRSHLPPPNISVCGSNTLEIINIYTVSQMLKLFLYYSQHMSPKTHWHI